MNRESRHWLSLFCCLSLRPPGSPAGRYRLTGPDAREIQEEFQAHQAAGAVKAGIVAIVAWVAGSDIAQITIQQHRQLADRLHQISVNHNVPLAILVEAVKRVFAVALVVLTDPRCTMSAADTAHGVEGLPFARSYGQASLVSTSGDDSPHVPVNTN